MLLADRELGERVQQVEALLGEIESLPDPDLRADVAAIVQGLVALYGEGIARLLEIIRRQGEPFSARMLDACVADDLVAHLLLLHDLHPVPLETRVARALEEVRPYLRSHGGNVELLAIEAGVARLRLQGSCSGCPSSTATLKLAIEEAIQKAAPDLQGIEAEGVVEPPPVPAGFVPVGALRRQARDPAAEPAWTCLGAPSEFSDGGLAVREVAGTLVLVCALDGTPYAYRDACPGCGRSLAPATLEDAQIGCPTCGRRYDVRRAGRCAEAPELFLEPIPLLVHGGLVSVKVGG